MRVSVRRLYCISIVRYSQVSPLSNVTLPEEKDLVQHKSTDDAAKLLPLS